MSFIGTVGGAKCVTIFHKDSYQWVNTYWFTKLGWESSDLAALAEEVDLTVSGALITYLSTQVHYDGTRVYGMQTIADPTFYVVTGAGAGGSSGQVLPLGDAMVATLRTGGRGRSARGRIYFSGFGEDHWDGSIYDTGIQGDVASFLGAIQTNAASVGWEWVVVSFQENGVKRSSGLARSVASYEIRSGIPGKVHRRNHRP